MVNKDDYYTAPQNEKSPSAAASIKQMCFSADA